MDTIDWLLDADPATSWQAMRDLTDASPAAVAAERARVAREGIGAEILARQEADGSWRRADGPVWLPTLFTFLFLRATGVDRADPAVESAVVRLETGLRWNDYPGCWDLRPPELGAIPTDRSFGCKPGGNPFFEGEEEPCINGGVLALGAYFGRPTESLADRLVREQLDDGGWNCEAPRSTRSSFHTTICVLEGLLEYQRAVGSESRIVPGITAARRRGEEYLLERYLFRRRSTGEVADQAFLEFAFPPRYHYDVLRALDYFRAAGDQPDARISDALRLIANKRQADGRWLLDNAHDEALAFPFSESVGGPSRWNTIRALRVLRWYEGRGDEPASTP
ncbi:MAG TPA: hypothetical protein VFD98_01965 [Terracidiphilus sp.]|nr:hypothetical protein [Terracidiphilus sp.]